MFALVVRFDLLPGAEDAFDQLVEETVAGIRAHEPGTLTYTCTRVVDEPNARVFFEVYADRDAFEEHERQPHTRRFLEQRERHLAGKRVEFLEPFTAKPALR